MHTDDHPARDDKVGNNGKQPIEDGPDYWHGLIDEKTAAIFLRLKTRTLQNWRRTGAGPEFIKISSRCIRYTRARLKIFSDERVRRSTSDPGQAA